MANSLTPAIAISLTRNSDASRRLRLQLLEDGSPVNVTTYFADFVLSGHVNSTIQLLERRFSNIQVPQTAKKEAIAVDALHEFEERAGAMFQLLFRNDILPSNRRPSLEALLQRLHGQSHFIIIEEDHDNIPWELLVDPSDPQTQFWGAKHYVVRTFPSEHAARFTDFDNDSQTRVSLISDSNLPGVRDIELPFLEAQHKITERSPVLILEKAPRLSQRSSAEDAKLSEFLANSSPHFVHFAVHADSSGPSLHTLKLPNHYTMDTWHVRRCVPFFNSDNTKPFVLLNTCRSSAASGLGATTLVREFLRRNVAGALASSIRVPDRPAAAFACYFYDRVFTGDALAKAITAARREFVQRYHSPVPLAYAFFTNAGPSRLPAAATLKLRNPLPLSSILYQFVP